MSDDSASNENDTSTRKVKGYQVAISESDQTPISDALGESLLKLQEKLGIPVWLMFQDGPTGMIDPEASKKFYLARRKGMLPNTKIALVIDSLGGLAEDAYEIARLLQRHCGGFIAVIPRHAKSAATLLSLGSDSILLAQFGELGPLDVQIRDPEREEWISGLDEVQSLERLQAFVMNSLDQTMLALCNRTRRKVTTMLPHVTKLVTDMAKPLFENIDVIRYTQMSRSLKVGEEYARRLLAHTQHRLDAEKIARSLVENYPVHSFVIDIEECTELGLELYPHDNELVEILDKIAENCENLDAVGSFSVVYEEE